MINETPGDTETLDGTKPDRNRDFAQSTLPRRDVDAQTSTLYNAKSNTHASHKCTLPSETTSAIQIPAGRNFVVLVKDKPRYLLFAFQTD